jgi:hypothetical protein
MDFTKHFATRLRALATPQNAPIPGAGQVPNSAGGFTWAVTRWDRLDRFLVLGSEGGTYYVGERELTVEGATAVAECIAEDGARVVARVVEISEAGARRRTTRALRPGHGGGDGRRGHPRRGARRAAAGGAHGDAPAALAALRAGVPRVGARGAPGGGAWYLARSRASWRTSS